MIEKNKKWNEGLSVKQTAFVEAWLKHLNAAKAAREAKYSKKTARQQGQRLLTNVDILNAIELRKAELDKLQGVASPEQILIGYTRDIRFDPRKLFDENEAPIPIKDLPDEIALSLVGYKIKERVIVSKDGSKRTIHRIYIYIFPNRIKSRDALAKYYGLFAKLSKQKSHIGSGALIKVVQK